MPKLSGINFYKSLANKPMVIFTTAYPEFAVEGFELNAIDYLMKPIAFERFLQAVQKVKDRRVGHEKTAEHIMLKVDKKLYRTPFHDILFFEAFGDYVKVHLSDQVLVITHTMKKLLTELPDAQFIRTHKSYIINKSKVAFVEGNQLKIGDQMVSIGQVYREQVLAALS
jgi:DNA-binding LytR/AlgR family response regulator